MSQNIRLIPKYFCTTFEQSNFKDKGVMHGGVLIGLIVLSCLRLLLKAWSYNYSY